MVENSCKVLKDISSLQCPTDEKQLEEKVNFDMDSTDVSVKFCLASIFQQS